MKLLKKLLPIASVASVAAVVTPLTVSCGKGVSNNFDYIPTIAPHEAVFFEGSEESVARQCAAMYFNDVKANGDIFVQDICAAFANYEKLSKLSVESGNVITKWNFSISIDNVTVKESTMLVEASAESIFLLSFDFKISRDYSWYTVDTAQGYKNTTTYYQDMNVSATVVDVPYRVVYDDGGWLVQPNYWNGILEYVPDDIRMEAHGSSHFKEVEENQYGVTEHKNGGDIGFLYDKYHAPLDDEEYIIRGYIQFVSYYLQNCSVA